MIKIEPVFLSFLATEILDIDTTEIEKYCYDLRTRESGREFSNRGGFQSRDLSAAEDSPLRTLLGVLDDRVNSLHASFMFKKSLRQKIDNLWVNINGNGDYNIPHVHPKACFSGVFYVKAESGCGDLYLRHPMPSIEHIISEDRVERFNSFTSPSIRIAPEPRKLVIFPSWILHYVDANRRDTDRISIAFNTMFESQDRGGGLRFSPAQG